MSRRSRMTRLSKSFSKHEGRYYLHFLGLRSRACSTGMLFFVLYRRIPPSSQSSVSLTIPISRCILISTIVHTSPFPVWLLSGLPTLVAILINVLTRRLTSIAMNPVMRCVKSRIHASQFVMIPPLPPGNFNNCSLNFGEITWLRAWHYL